MGFSFTFEHNFSSILKLKTSHYIYILFFLISFQGFFAQNLTLKLHSNQKIKLRVFDKINYQKKHKDTITLYSEIHKISNYFKNIGYFTNTVDSIKTYNRNYIAYFSLNEKIEIAIIKIDLESKDLFKNFDIKNNFQ